MKNTLFFIFALVLSITASAAPQSKNLEGKNLLTGENVVVNASDKKGMVVIFLSAKCPCSNSHNNELRDLAQTYKEFSFVAVHSNADEAKELSQPYFEKAAFPFPVIEDDKAKLADQLQASKTPHAFIFASNGDVLYEGGVSNSKDCAKADRKFLREALDDLHAGKSVRTPEGRTLGCAISRGEKNVW
jgi:thioredoxin-related protein